ncbi:MAG: AbrB/MazE/SpoVT family DNA-binding domain-containing protein [Gammaproteobacteria bacterium]|nr:AbrB/MazE/SpoVT family DNA-binding domain-containing protein [Gammaproteobacteria bacterium]
MRISERGQITIPKTLRDRFGMHHNVEVELLPTENGLLLQKRSTSSHPVDRMIGIFTDFGYESTDEFIEEIRGR